MNRPSPLLLLIGLMVTGAAISSTPATAQAPRTSTGVADRRTSAPPPIRGSESKRWEPWSNMRMAATQILGWKIGARTDSFPNLLFADSLVKIDELSLGNVEAFSNQKFDLDIPKDVNDTLQPDEAREVKYKLLAMNMNIAAYHVPSLGADESANRKLFEFATTLGVDTIVTDRVPDDLAAIDKLANEYKIKVAICGTPKDVLAAIGSASSQIGVCGDTGIWLEHGIKPVDALAQIGTRLFVINLQDRSALGRQGHVVLPGRGVAQLPKFLEEMYRMQLKPSLITVTGPAGTLASSFDAFEEALRPVMANKVDELSRTTPSRGPDRMGPGEKEKIDAALPTEAPAKPKKPRKLLVLDLNVAYGGHRSIPAENYAIEMMGKKTGAYETIFNNDLDNLKYPKIKEYDAIFLNNTVGMIFVDPEVRAGLLRFVREGGGLAGNHGTSHASMDWPEFHEMIGVRRGVHRANTEESWIKIDDPNSPLTAPFDGKEFLYQDEYFRFPNPPYSRTKLHELLSIDVAKTDMNQGVVFVPGSSVSRPDADYAVSWIRDYGKGRIFFCILGHNPTLFESPELAKYFLSGIQFILGDLNADATPGKAAPPVSPWTHAGK